MFFLILFFDKYDGMFEKFKAIHHYLHDYSNTVPTYRKRGVENLA